MAALLLAARSRSVTGLLSIEAGGGTSRLFLRGGAPCFAQVTVGYRPLGQVLVQYGLVDLEAFDRALPQLEKGRPLAEVLLEAKALDEAGLAEGLRMQLVEHLRALAALKDGAWEFKEQPLPAWAGPVALSAEWAVSVAMAAPAAEALVLGLLADLGANLLKLREGSEPLLASLHLAPEERAALEALREGGIPEDLEAQRLPAPKARWLAATALALGAAEPFDPRPEARAKAEEEARRRVEEARAQAEAAARAHEEEARAQVEAQRRKAFELRSRLEEEARSQKTEEERRRAQEQAAAEAEAKAREALEQAVAERIRLRKETEALVDEIQRDAGEKAARIRERLVEEAKAVAKGELDSAASEVSLAEQALAEAQARLASERQARQAAEDDLGQKQARLAAAQDEAERIAAEARQEAEQERARVAAESRAALEELETSTVRGASDEERRCLAEAEAHRARAQALRRELDQTEQALARMRAEAEELRKQGTDLEERARVAQDRAQAARVEAESLLESARKSAEEQARVEEEQAQARAERAERERIEAEEFARNAMEEARLSAERLARELAEKKEREEREAREREEAERRRAEQAARAAEAEAQAQQQAQELAFARQAASSASQELARKRALAAERLEAEARELLARQAERRRAEEAPAEPAALVGESAPPALVATAPQEPLPHEAQLFAAAPELAPTPEFAPTPTPATALEPEPEPEPASAPVVAPIPLTEPVEIEDADLIEAPAPEPEPSAEVARAEEAPTLDGQDLELVEPVPEGEDLEDLGAVVRMRSEEEDSAERERLAHARQSAEEERLARRAEGRELALALRDALPPAPVADESEPLLGVSTEEPQGLGGQEPEARSAPLTIDLNVEDMIEPLPPDSSPAPEVLEALRADLAQAGKRPSAASALSAPPEEAESASPEAAPAPGSVFETLEFEPPPPIALGNGEVVAPDRPVSEPPVPGPVEGADVVGSGYLDQAVSLTENVGLPDGPAVDLFGSPHDRHRGDLASAIESFSGSDPDSALDPHPFARPLENPVDLSDLSDPVLAGAEVPPDALGLEASPWMSPPEADEAPPPLGRHQTDGMEWNAALGDKLPAGPASASAEGAELEPPIGEDDDLNDEDKLRRQRLLRRAFDNLGALPRPAQPKASREAAAAEPAAPGPEQLSEEHQALAARIEARAASIAREDYFTRLGLQRTASAEQVKSAFLSAAMVFHPDRLPSVLGHLSAKVRDVFDALTEAQDALIDDARRAAYLQQVDGTAATKVRGDEVEALEKQAEAALRKKEFAHAAELYGRAFAISKNAGHLAQEAWSIYLDPEQRTNLAGVKRMLEQALKMDATCDRASYSLGVIARVEGDLDKAERLFRSAVHSNPKNAEASTELRLIEMRRKKPLGGKKGLFG